MVTVGMNYRVLPGKEQAFEQAFKAVLHAMDQMEGHSRSLLFKQVFDPQHYLIISDWSDRAAFDGFIASESFRRVADWGSQEILAGRPQHEVYER